MTEKTRLGTIQPFTMQDVMNAMQRGADKAIARARALGLEPVIRTPEQIEADDRAEALASAAGTSALPEEPVL